MNHNLGVSLADYQKGPTDNGAVFDVARTTPEDLAALSKALEAGQLTGRNLTNSATSGAQALKVESLENNLKLLTFKESDIVLWKRIPKLPAYNTVEEYNQLSSYGADRGGFTNEGELPEEEDSVYIRRAQLVKFLGVTKSITHPMTLVNTNIGPIMQREITNGTMWILRKINKSLTMGNENIIPQEFNGLYAQHAANDVFPTLGEYLDSDVVIDLRGKSLSESAIELAAEGIIENFGFGDLLMAPPRVLSDFVKSFYGNKFVPLPGGNTDSTVGHRVRKFASQFGDIDLVYDKFMNPGAPRKTTDGATHPAKSPSAPGALTVTTPVAAGSKLEAGDYFYAVAGVNRFGESVLTAATGLQTVAAGDAADLSFADGGGSYPATAYVVYRSKKNPTTVIGSTPLYPLLTVSVAQKGTGFDGAAAGLIRDFGRYVEDTYQAFLIQDSEEVYAFKQLAPLMKMDLALLGPAYRFMVLLYGTPQLYAPKKMVRFINIGKATSTSLNTIM